MNLIILETLKNIMIIVTQGKLTFEYHK